MRIWNCFMLFIVGSTLAGTSSEYNFKQLLSHGRVKRSQELNLSPEIICDRFTNPITSNKTFFSPSNGGENYPPDVNCILILEAPDDYVIQLDFRNNFNIELSPNCEYDFLEVRDGKYGFSDVLGKFCGNQFPSIISSSDRYLWLHFHSDDNIEYIGFEGVYNFTARPTNTAKKRECFITKNDTVEGRITPDDIDREIMAAVVTESITLDCIWMIKVELNWKIALVFEKFDLINKNDCVNNFLDVYGNDTNVSSPLKHFCAVVAEPFESKSNSLHIRFFANKNTINSTFNIYYSTFRDKKGMCESNELDCDDDTCISTDLKCNKRPNCKFQKDEEECPTDDEDKDTGLWFIVSIFGTLLGAMTSVFFFNCIRKLIRDQKIIREHIRQSKESKLDEAGRSSMKRSLENVNRIAARSTGYPSEAKTTQIHGDDVSQMFHEMEMDAASISHSLSRAKRPQYSYREQLKNILRNSPAPPQIINNNGEQYAMTTDGLCDMACQTRDSLYGDALSGKYSATPPPPRSLSTSQPPSDSYKFSTFGYNTGPMVVDASAPLPYPMSYASMHPTHLPYRDSRCDSVTHTIDITPTSTVIDNYEYRNGSNGETVLPAPPPPSAANMRHFNATTAAVGAPRKMEESCIMLEIRNSAPDVIIMTSH